MYESRFLETFQLRIPLVQAGMGGIAGSELAACVSNMGGLGVLAQYKNDPETIKYSICETRGKTAHYFGVNLIPEITSERIFERQIDAVIDSGVDKLAIILYGQPSENVARKIKQNNIPLIIQVGTTSDAKKAHSIGADAVVLQGIEAGGHLLGSLRTKDLLLEVSKMNLEIPLLVSGGISKGSDYIYYRELGASGCMCGTIFAASLESNAHQIYKELIVTSNAKNTVISDVFHIGWPGKRHRVIRNETVDMGKDQPITFIAESNLFGRKYPIPKFSAAAPLQQTSGLVTLMALYCGESCEGVTRIESVKEIIDRFASEIGFPQNGLCTKRGFS